MLFSSSLNHLISPSVLLLVVNLLVPFRLVMKLNILLAGVKIGTLLFVVLLSVRGEWANFSAPFTNSSLDPDDFVASFYGAFFAFEGYDVACVGVEEVVDPDRWAARRRPSGRLIAGISHSHSRFPSGCSSSCTRP